MCVGLSAELPGAAARREMWHLVLRNLSGGCLGVGGGEMEVPPKGSREGPPPAGGSAARALFSPLSPLTKAGLFGSLCIRP